VPTGGVVGWYGGVTVADAGVVGLVVGTGADVGVAEAIGVEAEVSAGGAAKAATLGVAVAV
jgi:hypothetical protein